ncbi:periplasmic heavy metal sensor [Oceanicaulis sp.]|uniref:periplasmic heavy metal sensor n=1 Tax=Oceanicaulis sp. TaxID=1924941 RepID=UPI003F6FE7EE
MSRINIWIALLLVSVLLNGVLIGAGAHRWLSDDGAGRASIRADASDAASVRGFEPRSFFRALPEDYRRPVFEQMEESREEVFALMRDLGEKRRAVRAVLTAEPFDPDAAQQALREAREARARLEQRTEALILDAAATLPADIRRAAFERALTRRGDRDHDRRHHGRHEDDRDDRERRGPDGPPPGGRPDRD